MHGYFKQGENTAYVIVHVCWWAKAAISSHSEREQHEQHSSAASPFEPGTQLRPQTVPSETELGSTGTAADMR